MTSELSTYIPLFVGLLVLAAFFAASETALLSFDWLRLRYLVRRGNASAATLERLLGRKDRLIGTILVANNATNIAASAIATAVAISIWGEGGIALATMAMTPVMLILAEIAPKTFAARHSESVALAVAPLYRFITSLLSPVVFVITSASNLVLLLLGSRPTAELKPGISEEEIRTLLTEDRSPLRVTENKKELLHGVFRVSRRQAREIMVPRIRVRAVEITATVEEAIAEMSKSGHSRLPVYREDLDTIVGIVHLQDLLRLKLTGSTPPLVQAVRPTFFVPETMTVENLLRDFQKRRTHMAAVVDEYGGVEGIVTLEDALEEIVGEIQDEHDLEGQDVRFLPGGEALVQGHASIRDINRQLKLKMPTDLDTTVGGFATTRLGHIPRQGESFVHERVRYTVERVGYNRVLTVRVTPITGEPPAGSPRE